ncbi:MAG: hypothetical protein E7379_00630 [Clostridiales bacterium]|nr:hypothetical protein [Clostridiales bacterium]
MKSRKELLKSKKVCRYCQSVALGLGICSLATLTTGLIMFATDSLSPENTVIALGLGATIGIASSIMDKLAYEKELKTEKELNILNEMGIE